MKQQPTYYAILTANVRYDNRLTLMQKIMHAEITALSNKNGYCSAGNKYFADLYECSTSTISKSVSKLEECGYIKVHVIKNEEGTVRHLYLRDPLVNNSGGVSNQLLTGVVNNYQYNNTSNNNIERETQKISFNEVMKMYVDTFGPNLCLTPNQGKHRRYIDELIARGFAKREFLKVMTAKKAEYDAGKFDTYVILPNALFKPDNFENNLAIINNSRKEAAKHNRKAAGKKVNDKFTKEATEKYKDGWI